MEEGQAKEGEVHKGKSEAREGQATESEGH
jgi:hypothetical protein